MKKILFVFVALLCCVFAGCDDDKAIEVFDMTVASVKYVPEYGFLPNAYLVKIEDAERWTLFWNGIEGFDYEEGYEYRIRVKGYEYEKDEIRADRGTMWYKLDKLLWKEKKDSDLRNP